MYATSTCDVRVDRLGTGDVAGLELLDEGVVDATDEADVVGLGRQGSGDADEEGALLLGEAEVGDVLVGLLVGVEAVDDREADLREVRGDRSTDVAVGEADTDDRVVAVLGEGAQTVLASGLGLAVLGLGLGAGGAELVDRLLHADGGGVVERLVAATADVVGEADLGPSTVAVAQVRRRCAVAAVVIIAGAAGQGEGAAPPRLLQSWSGDARCLLESSARRGPARKHASP